MQYNPKKYYIKTLGCSANLVDSNTMSGILDLVGFEEHIIEKKYKNEKEELLDVLPKIDLFIINSCSVRQKSEDKVYGVGKIISLLKQKNKKLPHIILSGCMVGSVTGDRQRYDFLELKQKTPWVEIYINPSQIPQLPDILYKAKILNKIWYEKFRLEKVNVKQLEKNHAYINISYGCDNFCTYCVVPYARGEEKSRSEKEIISEVINLVKRGFSHITLCAQNVNSWGLAKEKKLKIRSGSTQKLPFADLLRKLCKIEGLTKIDFISSNPFDFTNDLIEAIKDPKISNYFHIAVQSGNDEVLKRMSRRHTTGEFFKLIDSIKKVRPDAEFGTDIIVGFPGETDDQFMDTVKLFEKIKFNVAFISIYSSRKGTTAERLFEDNVSLEDKRYRHKFLTKVWLKSKKK